MLDFFTWAYDLIMSITNLWSWLVTPVSILGFIVAPIYLVGGTMLTVGITRAILGILT